MKLYLLRHGKADWPDWNRPDDERPLDKEGRREMKRIARFLGDLKLKPMVLLTSPLPRALQTAEIAGEALDLEVRQERGLAPGFSVTKLRALLKRIGDRDVMIVGHEPDFTKVIGALTGADAKLGKGGIARVDLEDAHGTAGQLIWLIPPRILRR